MNTERRIEFLKTANRELAMFHAAAGRMAESVETVNQARENIEFLWSVIASANTLLETLQQGEQEAVKGVL